jgi:hypothetical protein
MTFDGWIKSAPSPLGCCGGGLEYASVAWMDTHVPDEVWLKISPTGHEGGVLCISCMARRCVVLGIECEVQIGSGPFCNGKPYAAD